MLTVPATRPGPRALWSEAGLADVESCMLQLCSGERLERLGTIAWEHVASGGKRLRARLALAALEVLGGTRSEAVGWAAACELLHNATLLHDDVQDGDRTRRGRPAAWVKHGVAQAINAGDLCLVLPWRALEHVPVDDARRWLLARALARGAERVARGQAAELELLGRRRLSWEAYAEAVAGKTAALFALPVEGAALIAGWSPEQAAALGEAVAPVGVLFQVQDDVLDLYGDKGRAEPASDVREGRVTSLVVEHLRLHPAQRDWLLSVLEGRTGPDEVAEVRRRFAGEGALDAVWGRLDAIEDALDADPLITSSSRLHALVFDLLSRALAPIVHVRPDMRGGR